MNARTVLLLGALFGWFSGDAQAPFEIDDAVEERNFMPYELTYFVDEGDKLTFNEISSVGFSNRFKTHSNYQNVDFITNAAYWIRLPIRHTTNSRKT